MSYLLAEAETSARYRLFSFLPTAFSNGMVGIWMGTKEAIVVLDDHDGSFEARIFQGFDPLIGIQMLWIEIIRVFLPISPLTIVVSSSQSG